MTETIKTIETLFVGHFVTNLQDNFQDKFKLEQKLTINLVLFFNNIFQIEVYAYGLNSNLDDLQFNELYEELDTLFSEGVLYNTKCIILREYKNYEHKTEPSFMLEREKIENMSSLYSSETSYVEITTDEMNFFLDYLFKKQDTGQELKTVQNFTNDYFKNRRYRFFNFEDFTIFYYGFNFYLHDAITEYNKNPIPFFIENGKFIFKK